MSHAMLIVLGGLLALCESVPGVGVVLPGELIITSTSTLLSPHQLPLLFLAVLIGACAGDQMNYWIGRRLGPRLTSSWLARRIGTDRWDRAADLTVRRGAIAVLVSRILPVVRAVMPGVAGVARMPFATFTAASVAGSAVWATAWVCLGSAASALVSRPELLLLVFVPLLLIGSLGRRFQRQLNVGAR
jgi:membrane-associated protein